MDFLDILLRCKIRVRLTFVDAAKPVTVITKLVAIIHTYLRCENYHAGASNLRPLALVLVAWRES